MSNAHRTAVLAAVLGVGAAAQAATIGINFGANESGLDSTDATGVVEQQNWVNAPNSGGSNLALQDSNGNAAGAVSYTGDGVGGAFTSPANPFQKLLDGYLHGDSDNTTGGSGRIDRTGVDITITDLPSALVAGGYDLIVYWKTTGADQNVGPRIASVDLGNDGSVDATASYTNVGNSATTFVEGTNYIRIGLGVLSQGVTSFKLNLAKAGGEANSERGVINGLQVVPVPEPTATALLGLGGALVLAGRGR